jgi:DNA-binding NarL/FixJ family response regulator
MGTAPIRRRRMIQVLIVGDNAMFNQAFARLLERQPDMEVAALASSLVGAREKLSGVDVAIIDRGLPDGDGLELIGELRQASPGAGVLVLSLTLEHAHPGQALEAGADEILDKLAAREEIISAIHRVSGG